MKCIYSVLRPAIEQKSYADLITNCSQKCSVSTKGLVAFTSSFCLNQLRPQSVSYHVYVVDLNRPYQPYLIAESEHKFTILEWDPSGTKLLLCDSHGCATIYTSKDFLISDWRPYFKQVFAAETFISACWYHPGIISTINVPQSNLKTSSNHLEYSDKIQQNKFSASLRLFGGKAAEGCLLISQTGLVCCLTLMADGTVGVVSESLNPLRVKLHVADVSYHKDGSFIVGTSSGSINSTISFYKVSLSLKNITLDDVDSFANGNGDASKRISITSKQFYSFHLNVMSQILNERENTCAFERVNHIKFVSKDSPNDVLIEVSGQNLSLIELWELESKRHPPVHNAILELKRESEALAVTIKQEVDATNGGGNQQQQQQHYQQAYAKQTDDTTAASSLQTNEWSFKGNYITDKSLISIQTPKFRIFGPNRQLNLILLAYEDSSVCCLRKDDLQPIEEPLQLSTDVPIRLLNGRMELDSSKSCKVYSGNVYNNRNNNRSIVQSNGGSHLAAPIINRPLKNRTNFITDLQLSANQTVFVAVDSMSQLHVVRLPTLISCQDAKDEETYLQYMLEFCLITGNDWWDVLVCTKRESIATICDKFHDAYERQPKQIQRKYFNRQLMIRASLYRCLNEAASLCKSSDCHTMIMLNSIASTHKSMLRSQDKDSPSDQLSQFLKTQGTQANFFNMNNVLAKISEKEFYVETQLIQCLQPLNQWVIDLAIFLLISLPQQIKSQRLVHLPGAGLIKNKEAIETLRELLVIIKIWGKQNVASLPVVYRLNDQLDVISTLFKLISIHYATMNNNESDETLLEECIMLANNITITHFEYFLSATGVASPYLHSQQDISGGRLVMEYFHELNLPEWVQLDKIEGCIDMNGPRKIDIVRNISLGAYPLTNVRHCTRCRGVSLMRPMREAASFISTRIWEQRWMTTCVCGGHWAQSDGMFSNKMSSLALVCNTGNFVSLSQLANQLAR